ncbi:hypothetical protein [Streptomyces sp. NBC_01314]|uniref:hypothetical protein n=1 Tax=Streptomyces sp. NBC_01314 TaxID=2903821 RepID=UPI00308E7E06|nr:hypothetical protein OG622_43255 [Streptomyces sp. NBC_01314]
MHLDLVCGPLRIAEGDFPNREWMLGPPPHDGDHRTHRHDPLRAPIALAERLTAIATRLTTAEVPSTHG